MKKQIFLVVLITAIVFANKVYAGKETGGGDHIRPNFIKRGELLIRFLKESEMGQAMVKTHQLSVTKLEGTLDLDKIKLTNAKLTSEDSDVEALGQCGLITLNSAEWKEHFDKGRPVDYLILHEMLRSGCYNDNKYIISKPLIGLNVTYTLSLPVMSAPCDFSLPQLSGEKGLYKDPYYAKYMLPGQIDYSEIFAAYDKAKPMREEFQSSFMAKVAQLKFDENGVIVIRKTNASVAYLAHYAHAVRLALSPLTGLQVANALIQPDFTVLQFGPFGGHYSNIETGFYNLSIFATLDPHAEKKIELIKMEGMRSIEEAAHRLRNEIVNLHRQDLEMIRRHMILTKLFGITPSLEEIISVLKEADRHPSKQYVVMNMTIEKPDSKNLAHIRVTPENLMIAQGTLANITKCLAEGQSVSPDAREAWLNLGKELVGR